MRVSVVDDEIEVDFTGTDPQARGNVNAVEAVTVSAVAYALRELIAPNFPRTLAFLGPETAVTIAVMLAGEDLGSGAASVAIALGVLLFSKITIILFFRH